MKDVYLAQQKMLFYNSDNRQSGELIYDHQAQFPSESFQQDIEKDDIIELELVQFSCEQSYYNISSSRNNSFEYSEDSGSSWATVALSEGNYDVNEMTTVIKNGLDTAGSLTWTVAVNLNTLKYTFTYTGTPSGSVIFKETSPLKAFSLLGFESGVDKTVISGTESDKLVSIGNVSDMFIHCDITQSYHVANETSLNSVFAGFPITTPFFGLIVWEKASDFSPKIRLPTKGAGNTNRLKFSLRDKYDNYIKVTKDYTMALRLNIYRPKSRNVEKLLAMSLMKDDE